MLPNFNFFSARKLKNIYLMDCTYRKKTREFIGIHRKEIAESEGG